MSELEIMTHVVAGYRSLKETEKLIHIMADYGSDYIEVQIPFSDPIGDGPVITQANQVGIDNGITPENTLVFIEKMAKKISTPLIIMTYANIPFRIGFKSFIRRAQNIGVRGLIIPDLPYSAGTDEEIAEAFFFSSEYAIPIIPVLSPNTTERRMEFLGREMTHNKHSLMVYCTRRTGITGTDRINIPASESVDLETDKYLEHVREYFPTKIAVGFGLSSVEQVLSLVGKVDIAVIGSHIINLYKHTPENSEEGFNQIKFFLTKIKQLS